MNNPKSAIVSRLKVIKNHLDAAWPRVQTELPSLWSEETKSKDYSHFASRLKLCLKDYKTVQDEWPEKLVADIYVTLAELDQLIRIDEGKLFFPSESLHMQITSQLIPAAFYTVEVKYSVAALSGTITHDKNGKTLVFMAVQFLPGATYKAIQLCEQLIYQLDDMPF